jgi:hypothetical protein
VLYNGPFKPEYHELSGLPYQNFTVTVPADLAKGSAVVGVAHAALVGVCSSFSSLALSQRVMGLGRLC